jgi:hypothetical protein
MPVATADFHILKGAAKGWCRASPSGAEVTSWFCSDCGARIYGERQGRPEVMNLRAGTLDDTSWLVPIAHFFTSRAQGWIQPAAGAECYALQPPDFGELAFMARDVAGILSPEEIVPLLGNPLTPWGIGLRLGGCVGRVD